MHISGSGHIPGGNYNEKVSISGSGKVCGHLRCTDFSCSGSGKCAGDLICEGKISISGSGHFDKNIEAENVSVSGSMRADGNVTVKENFSVSGSAKCGGNLKCAVLKCSGAVEIGGEVEAEEARISGKINCGGLLNAEKTDISLFGSCRIGSIGGSEIKIYKESKNKVLRMPLLSKLVGSGDGHLTVDESIEGDTVALEYTSAPKVVGRIVAVGEGCVIDLVQYSEQIEIYPDAKVARQEKI